MDRRKAIVRDGYDAVARVWSETRRAGGADARERSFLDRFFATIPEGGRVLDLGCGGGAILGELIERGYRAVGVDFSHAQLEEARTRSPAAELRQGDFTEVEIAPASFDAVIAYDSIWNVPREEHARLFARIRGWLVPGGAALFTVGAVDEASGEGLFTQLEGAPMFYDAWPEAVSLALLREAGFRVVAHDLRPVEASQPGRGHLVVLASAE